MISLTAALEGVCTLWPRNGSPREVPASTSSPAITPTSCSRASAAQSPPAGAALEKRFAFRHVSLTKLGRSAALLIGTQAKGRSPADHHGGNTAARALRFERVPSAVELGGRSMQRIPADGYFNDVHGSADYKHHLTYYFAEQIRAELAQPERRMNNPKSRRNSSTWPAADYRRRQMFFAEPRPDSACAPSCAIGGSSASRRAAMPATAAPAPSGSTARRCIPA